MMFNWIDSMSWSVTWVLFILLISLLIAFAATAVYAALAIAAFGEHERWDSNLDDDSER